MLETHLDMWSDTNKSVYTKEHSTSTHIVYQLTNTPITHIHPHPYPCTQPLAAHWEGPPSSCSLPPVSYCCRGLDSMCTAGSVHDICLYLSHCCWKLASLCSVVSVLLRHTFAVLMLAPSTSSSILPPLLQFSLSLHSLTSLHSVASCPCLSFPSCCVYAV